MFSIVVIFILPAADLALFGQKARPLPSHREPFRVPLKWRSAELRSCVGIAANSQPASSPRRTIRGMARVCVWGMILDSRTHVMQPCASFSAVECIRPILHVRFLVQILGQFSSYIFGFTTFKNIISSNLLLTRFRLIVWCVFKSIFWIYFFCMNLPSEGHLFRSLSKIWPVTYQKWSNYSSNVQIKIMI